MKNKLLLIAALIFVLIVAGFAIFIKNQKDQIAKEIQEQKQLEQQKDADAQKQAEEQKELESQRELEKQKAIEAEKKQSEAKKIQSINSDIDKIEVRLDKLYNDTGSFVSITDDQKNQEEERLKQLENATKAEIGDIEVDLDGKGFTNKNELEKGLDDFYLAYHRMIFAEEENLSITNTTDAAAQAVMAKSHIYFLRIDSQP